MILLIVFVSSLKKLALILRNWEQYFVWFAITMQIMAIYLLIKHRFVNSKCFKIKLLFLCLESISKDFTKVGIKISYRMFSFVKV